MPRCGTAHARMHHTVLWSRPRDCGRAGRSPATRGHGRGQRGRLTLGKRRAAGGDGERRRCAASGDGGAQRAAATVRSERRRRAASATARTRARARRRQPGGVVVCVSSSRDGGGGREPTRYMHKGHRSRAKPRPGTFESLFPGGNRARDLCRAINAAFRPPGA